MTFEIPQSPAELAQVRAEQNTSDSFEISPIDRQAIVELEYAAENLGFIGANYFVESDRALIIPASYDASQDVTYTNFYGLSFEGTFATYSKVHIGRVIGGQSVRAVCLAFSDALLLPFFDRLEKTDILYVPVLAVAGMEKTV